MFVENKALVIGAAAVAFFVAAVLILLVFRLAFGRRLRMANNRARQMRLGIVDAFDLDRQRQLVIVRRDNVEHLVMIGGPNDILIESQIVRTETRSRDKDARDRDLTTVAATKVMAAEPKVAIPPPPEPLQPIAASDEFAPPTRAPFAPPAGPITGMSMSPRRTAPPPIQTKPAPTQMPPAQAPAIGPAPFAEPSVKAPPPLKPAAQPPAMSPVASGQSASPQPAAPPAVPGLGSGLGSGLGAGPGPAVPPPTGGEQPAFVRWPARNPGAPFTGAAKPAAKAPGDLPPLPTPRPKQPAAAQTEPAVTFPPVPSMEGLESLEEEMAKLLGRGPGK